MKVKRMSFLILVVCLCLSVVLISSAASDTRPSSSPGPATPLLTLNPAIDTLVFAGSDAFWIIGAEKKPVLKKYTGFLTKGAQLMCTKSEGPVYFLQFYQDEQNGIKVLKHGSNAPFAHDLTLDAYLLTKVTIVGMETPAGLRYISIEPFDCGLGKEIDLTEKDYDGYLFAKLDNIGTRSEGPSYYLQGFDYSEIHVAKTCDLSQNDPKLHPFLNTKVTITGTIGEDGLVYKTVEVYKPPKE